MIVLAITLIIKPKIPIQTILVALAITIMIIGQAKIIIGTEQENPLSIHSHPGRGTFFDPSNLTVSTLLFQELQLFFNEVDLPHDRIYW